jgi:hypothetical protein
MIDLFERIGPYLGVAAFLGLAVLAFLIIQQAREVRRLREWAGRAPERATAAADAAAAAAEARGEEPEEPEEAEADSEPEGAAEEPTGEPGRLGRLRAAGAARFAGLDRRMPVDPRYLLAVLAAVVIAAAVLTSGFGLVGGDDGGGGDGGGGGKGGGKESKPEKVEVAVLNATQVEDGPVPIDAVSGLAAKIADEVVKPADFKVATEQTATSGFAETTIMFESGAEEDADELAAAVSDQLGETPVTPMIGEVRELSEDAPLALIVGQDDAEF